MSTIIQPTREHVDKILELLEHGLVSGLGVPEPGKMCVEALVCHAMGLPHSDEPPCVAPALRRLKIALNDRAWSSGQARARGLRRLALAQLGSADALDEQEFRRRVVDMTIRKAVPAALRSAASVNPNHAEALESAAVRCEQEGSREACKAAEKIAAAAAASAAADAAAADASASAAYASAAAAAAASASAADASAYAAYASAAAYAADAAAAYAADAAAAYAARRAARDSFLSRYAEWVVEILIDMQAPGCQWLALAPQAA